MFCMAERPHIYTCLMSEYASNLKGFWAVKGTFWQKILNYGIEVRGGVTSNALHTKIMLAQFYKGSK